MKLIHTSLSKGWDDAFGVNGTAFRQETQAHTLTLGQ